LPKKQLRNTKQRQQQQPLQEQLVPQLGRCCLGKAAAADGATAQRRLPPLPPAVRARRVQLAQVRQREEEWVGRMGMRPAGSRISC
jgi:hypothetical protein